MDSETRKQALKELRDARKSSVERAMKAIKDQAKMIKSIKGQLGEGPKTVPELAEALSFEPSDVLLFVSALRKYGEVNEGAKDGDYFKYELAQ